MNKLSISLAVILGSFCSSTLMAERSIEQISAINYQVREIIMGGEKYYLPAKIRTQNGRKLPIDINSLREGMVVNIDYQPAAGKPRRINFIESAVH